MFISTNFNTDIPKLYEQQDKKHQVAYVKYSVPGSDWTWYILEYSKSQQLFYGYLEPDNEYGYFTIDELIRVILEYNVDIEQDVTFKPQMLHELIHDFHQ